MHRRLGSATLLQLALPGESNQNFPWEKSHLDNAVVVVVFFCVCVCVCVFVLFFVCLFVFLSSIFSPFFCVKMTDFFPIALFTASEVIQTSVMDGNRHLTPATVRVCVRQERRENVLLQSQLCVLTLIRCPFYPRVTAVARKRPRSFCRRRRRQVRPKQACTLDPTKTEWADYGNTKTPIMHPTLRGTTLSQLAFSGEGNPNFPSKKSHWDNTFVKKNIFL